MPTHLGATFTTSHDLIIELPGAFFGHPEKHEQTVQFGQMFVELSKNLEQKNDRKPMKEYIL